MRRMRGKISLLLTLFAWLIATGSHWDVVQTFAWGRMFVTYAQSMPVTRALRLTFSPEGECGICRVVEHAKQQQPDEGVPARSLDKKMPLALAPVNVLVLAAPPPAVHAPADARPPAARRARPPVPPPRQA